MNFATHERKTRFLRCPSTAIVKASENETAKRKGDVVPSDIFRQAKGSEHGPFDPPEDIPKRITSPVLISTTAFRPSIGWA